MLILKRINTKRLIAITILVIVNFSMKIGEYNIIVYGIAQQTWIGIALLIIGCMWILQYTTFKINGIARSDTFEKDLYSTINEFELTNEIISYSTKNGLKYNDKILFANLKTMSNIKKKIENNVKNYTI